MMIGAIMNIIYKRAIHETHIPLPLYALIYLLVLLF
jgi:hypothetical protein